MSKFNTILNRISENLPPVPQSQVAGQPQKPATPTPTPSTTPQQTVDPNIIKELIAATNEQQVNLALQKLQATQQASNNKPAV